MAKTFNIDQAIRLLYELEDDEFDSDGLENENSDTNMNTDVGDVYTNLGDANLNLGDVNTNLGDVNKNLGDVNTNFGDRNTNLGDVNTNLDDVYTNLGDVNTNLGDLNTNLGDINTNLDYVYTNLGDVNTNLGDLNRNLGDLNTNLGDINSNLGDRNTNLGDVNTNLDDVYTNLGDVNTNLGDLNTNLGDINTNLDYVYTNLGDLNTKVGDVNKNLGDMNTNLGDRNTNLGDVNTNLGDVNRNLGDVNTNIGDAYTNVGDMNMNLGNQNEDVMRTVDNSMDLDRNTHLGDKDLVDKRSVDTRNDITSEEITPNISITEKNIDENRAPLERSRKRKRNEARWQRNVTKRRREVGKDYISSSGKTIRARVLQTKKNCTNCKFKCNSLISEVEREGVFHDFWKLNNEEKCTFYASTVNRTEKSRKTTKETSRRKYTYQYHFNLKDGNKIRVCKDFYLGTLDISQRRIEYFFNTSPNGNHKHLWGKHTKKKVSQESEQIIKDHIDSFPRMPSHYCRNSTKKEFLEAGLSINQMYNLYKESCQSRGLVPEKEHVYRRIFNHNFNIGFYVPKKDRCDTCEEERLSNEVDGLEKFAHHKADKERTKIERDIDRSEKDRLVVCFDLENVFTCPRANVSNFFYKRKLNVYNLTAHCSLNKEAYNAIWHEVDAGRGANEIASALIKILKTISETYPEYKSLILWSDSCIPQNRNSAMSFALMNFTQQSNFETVTQKFCTPGHSSIQEVDNVHSHVEKTMKLSETYSPISLMRVLKSVRPEKMNIIQMRQHDFMEYHQAACKTQFKNIPFTKVKCIRYKKANPFHPEYKTSFSEPTFSEVCVRGKKTRTSDYSGSFPGVRCQMRKNMISNEKLADIKSMYKFMPEVDRQFYQVLERQVSNLN